MGASCVLPFVASLTGRSVPPQVERKIQLPPRVQNFNKGRVSP